MVTWRDYVKEIWRDSFALWERGERMTVFASVVLGSLLLGIFLSVGIGITFKPEAGLWASGILFGWLAILVLFVSPFRLWKTGRLKIKELEQENEPKIEVLFDPRSSNCVEVLKNEDGEKIGRIHRIILKNLSKARTIENIRVCVQYIKGWDHAFTNTPLCTINEEAVFYLNPGAKELVNVFLSADGPRITNFQIYYADQNKRVSVPRDPKEICIQVQGKDMKDETRWVQTDTTSGGKLTVQLIEKNGG